MTNTTRFIHGNGSRLLVFALLIVSGCAWIPKGDPPAAYLEPPEMKETLAEVTSRLEQWPDDRWWIWKEIGNVNDSGFNRIAQQDKGAVRHNRRSNYTMADSSAALLDAARIPCNTAECWWSVKTSPRLKWARTCFPVSPRVRLRCG